MKEYDVIIIGGVAAGTSAGAAAKRINPSLNILLIQKEPYISYGGCGLPYYVEGIIKDIDEVISFTPEKFREKKGVEVITKTEVYEVNFEKKQLKAKNLETGEDMNFEYDKLVISTGASPIVPNFEGIEDKRIFTIRNPEDAVKIRAFIENNKPKNAVIVGGGYIGVEMSEAIASHGVKVSIVEMLDRLLTNAEPEINEFIIDSLKKNEVDVLLETKVEKFIPGEKIKVVTNKGELEADFVLLAVGVKPNTEIFGNEIRKGIKGAIVVDEHSRTNIEDVYAAGDCATAKNIITKEDDYVPLGTTANKQGRVAGRNLAGFKDVFKGIMRTMITKIFDIEFGKTGFTEREAKDRGFDAKSIYIKALSKAHYYPTTKPVHLKLVFDTKTGKILGVQMAGNEVHRRVDVFATAIQGGLTIDELAYLDLGYAPPFSPVWDPVLVAAGVARKHVKK